MIFIGLLKPFPNGKLPNFSKSTNKYVRKTFP